MGLGICLADSRFLKHVLGDTLMSVWVNMVCVMVCLRLPYNREKCLLHSFKKKEKH